MRRHNGANACGGYRASHIFTTASAVDTTKERLS